MNSPQLITSIKEKVSKFQSTKKIKERSKTFTFRKEKIKVENISPPIVNFHILDSIKHNEPKQPQQLEQETSDENDFSSD